MASVADDTVRFSEVASGKQANAVTVDQGGICSVGFSVDGRHLATGGSDGTVRLWDTGGGKKELAVFAGHQGEVLAVTFSPDGQCLASSSADGTVRLWEILRGRQAAVLAAVEDTWIVACAGAVQWGGDRSRIYLAVANPTSLSSTLFLPPGRMLDVCDRPDLVRAALLGAPPALADLFPDESWHQGSEWDGASTEWNQPGPRPGRATCPP